MGSIKTVRQYDRDRDRAEQLWYRLTTIDHPTTKHAKRYARASCREQGKHPAPSVLSRFLRKVKRITRARPYQKRYDLWAMVAGGRKGASSTLYTCSGAEALREQVENATHLRTTTITEGDPDMFAGGAVPTVLRTYRAQGLLVKLLTYPDWDNYHEDWTITVDGVVLAIWEN